MPRLLGYLFVLFPLHSGWVHRRFPFSDVEEGRAGQGRAGQGRAGLDIVGYLGQGIQD